MARSKRDDKPSGRSRRRVTVGDVAEAAVLALERGPFGKHIAPFAEAAASPDVPAGGAR